MRTSLTLICALVLLASPYFFAYLEAERLLGWPDPVYRWLDPWLPIVVIVATTLMPIVLPGIIGFLNEPDRSSSRKGIR